MYSSFIENIIKRRKEEEEWKGGGKTLKNALGESPKGRVTGNDILVKNTQDMIGLLSLLFDITKIM